MFVTRTKVAAILPLYRDGESAMNIEAVRTALAEFDLVTAKNRFVVNQTCLYIITDVKIPDNGFFEEYIRPDGNAGKSKLNKTGRLRAIKFKFNLNPTELEDYVFSQGIILSNEDLPKSFFEKYGFENLDQFPEDFDWDLSLGIIKWIAENNSEGNVNGCPTREFPSFLYKTDETRIEAKKFEGSKKVRISQKRDGESFTAYLKSEINNEFSFHVCSRNLEKVLEGMEKLIELKDSIGNVYRPFFDKESMSRGFKDFTNNIFVPVEMIDKIPQVPEGFIGIYGKEPDSFVDTAMNMNLKETMIEFAKEKDFTFALRGELIGKGHHQMKHNLDSIGNSRIVFFGFDEIILGHNNEPISCKRRIDELELLKEFCERYDYEYTIPLTVSEFTYEEIISFAKNFFKTVPCEGVVIRGENYSAKYINADYDSKS